jgi:hypothetical protein
MNFIFYKNIIGIVVCLVLTAENKVQAGEEGKIQEIYPSWEGLPNLHPVMNYEENTKLKKNI